MGDSALVSCTVMCLLGPDREGGPLRAQGLGLQHGLIASEQNFHSTLTSTKGYQGVTAIQGFLSETELKQLEHFQKQVPGGDLSKCHHAEKIAFLRMWKTQMKDGSWDGSCFSNHGKWHFHIQAHCALGTTKDAASSGGGGGTKNQASFDGAATLECGACEDCQRYFLFVIALLFRKMSI